MKAIKVCFVVILWFAATSLVASMILDCMEWEAQRRIAAAAEYRRQMDAPLPPHVVYAVYECEVE